VKKEKSAEKSKNPLLRILLRDLFFVAVIVIFTGGLYLLTGENCLFRALFHIECPFCGMTRAHLAALRLDFAAAFGYHPLFFLGVPFLFLISHDMLFKGRLQKPYEITVILLLAAFVINFVIGFFI
jgi:hypothetical protein